MRNRLNTVLPSATAIALAILLLAPAALRANIYTVDSTDDRPDANTADGICATAPPIVCTLRAAVMQANAGFSADVIDIPAGTYVLGSELAIAHNNHELTIEGGSGSVIIDANGADRALEVIDTPLTLFHLAIRNGNASSNGGAIYAHGGTSLSLLSISLHDNSAALDGGAIYAIDMDVGMSNGDVTANTAQGSGGGIAFVGQSADPTLFLTGVEIAANQAQGTDGFAGGGGVSANRGSVVLNTCFLHDNTALRSGGGVLFLAFAPDSLHVADSIFDHNAADQADGGGLLALGQDMIERTRFSNNSASFGGAISGQSGPHTWTDVAISGNHAVGGGGAEMGGGSVTVLRGRIDANTATFAGGGGFYMAAGSLELADSQVFGNSAAKGGGALTSVALTATTSAIYGNHATTAGGGIYADDTAVVEINDSILDHNGAGANGGGLYVDSMAQARLYSATITSNGARQNYPSPGTGGGVYVVSPAAVTAVATVLAYNINSSLTAAPSDCSGTLTAAGYDFVGTSGGCTIVVGGTGNQIGSVSKIDPQLGPFERLYDPALPAFPSASPKFGRVPLAGSPLINAGPPSVFPLPGCTDAGGNALFRDEIGQLRALGGRCDIGAIEFGAALDGIFADDFDG